MLQVQGNLVPLMTSEAGLCLTKNNWQEVKVSASSYFLEHLLYKPGLDALRELSNAADYLACPGLLVLNASSLKSTKESIYLLKSPYDGSRLSLTYLGLHELIHRLKPNVVILPPNILHDFPHIWDKWDHSITPFVAVNDWEQHHKTGAYGVYFNRFSVSDWEQLTRWSHVPRYVMGDFTPEVIQKLRQEGINFIETDKPAESAIEGKAYSHTGEVDLNSLETQMRFDPIDKKCSCPTCKQQFTQAYLHHLVQHTPLLAQRLLIQHNLFYVQNN